MPTLLGFTVGRHGSVSGGSCDGSLACVAYALPIEKAAQQLGFAVGQSAAFQNASAAVKLLQHFGVKAEDLNCVEASESDDVALPR